MENSITLLKVPKFLATLWRSSDNNTIVGYCKKNDNDELEELIIGTNDGSRMFKCRKTQYSNPTAVKIDDSSLSLRNIGNFSECLTIYPSMDQSYRNKLKERHISANVQKARSTTNETREDPSFDSSDTLFKYYNPKSVTIANMVGYEARIEDLTASRVKKDRVKRYPVLDADELKMKIFKIFESEEAKDGIQLKRVVQIMNQPMQTVKAAVEEIAIQKRRASDHKMVYYLKYNYNDGILSYLGRLYTLTDSTQQSSILKR